MPGARRRIPRPVGPGRFRLDRGVGRESAAIGGEQGENRGAGAARELPVGNRADDLVTLVAEGQRQRGRKREQEREQGAARAAAQGKFSVSISSCVAAL
jgi:hypothetical protein